MTQARSSEMTELQDALDDALRRAYCENLETGWDGVTIAAALDPFHMRQLRRLQTAAWDAVKERVE